MKAISITAFFLLLVAFSSAHPHAAPTKVKDTTCDACNYVVGIIENWVLSNYSTAEIETYLQTLCTIVPAYSQVCDQIVDSGIEEVIQYIKNDESPQQICTQLGLCTSTKKTAVVEMKKLKAANCDLCKYVVGIVEGWLLNNSTEEQAVQYLEQFCKYVPGFEAVCDQIVVYGVQEFVNYVNTNEQPATVCNQIGLCSSLTVPAPSAVSDTTCDGCKYIVSIVESYLITNSSVEEIEQYLQTFCALVPGFEQTCDQIVNAGLQDFILYVKYNEDPESVCTQINLCSSKTFSKKKTMAGVKSGNCDLCVYVVNIVESWLLNNATEAEAEQYLQTLCSRVPGFEQICDQIVDYGFAEFIQYVQTNEQPTTVCNQIGLCSSPLKVAKVKDAQCDLCTYVISVIESYVLNNASEAQIEQALDSVCKLIPGAQQICDQIVNQGLSIIIQWIQQNETPQQICTQLQMCSSSKRGNGKKIVEIVSFKKIVPQVSDLDCSLCQTVIEAVEHWLENNATESEIETDLEDYICVLIPGFQSTCDAIIETGVPDVVQWIENNETPQAVCQQLGLCSSGKREGVRVRVRV